MSKPKEVVLVSELGRTRWLQMRQKCIGASQSALILGVSPFGGPYDAYLQIVEGMKLNDTPHMRRGRRLEAAVLDMLRDEAEIEISGSVFVRSGDHDWLTATPDGVVRGEGGRIEAGAEAKTANPWNKDEWGDEGTDHIPDHYRVQVAHQLLVLDVDVCHLGVLFGVDDFRRYEIPRRADIEGMIVEGLEKFWRDHVLPQKPPDMEGARHLGEWLAKRYPRDTRPMAVATTQQQWMMAEAKRVIEVKALVDRRVEFFKNRFKYDIGDQAGIIKCEGSKDKVTWKQSKGRKTTNWKGLAIFKGATDEEIAQYTKHAEGSRRFLWPAHWKKGVE
jgi:putative phage-type endonuclease